MPKKFFIKNFILFFILYTILFINSSKFYIYAENLSTETTTTYQTINTPTLDLSVTAESAVLMDAKTGIVLYDKNMNEKVYPASTTKILTALLVLENLDLNQTIKHSKNAIFNIGAGGSNAGMKENEEITAEDALYAILLKSANEVSMAVAETISETSDNFVQLMNEKAQELGAKNTNFQNPHGYHNKNHYTTSYDMALIMKEAIKNPTFLKVISTKSYTIPQTNLSPERHLVNSNKLILNDSPFYYEYVLGGKTGFTNEAGNTLISYAEKDDVSLIAVVMKDKGTETYTDTIKMFNYGFSSYEQKTIFEKSSFTKTIPVIQNFGDKQIALGDVTLEAKSNLSLNLPKTINTTKISQKINLKDSLTAPISIGETVGTIDFIYEGDVFSTVDIISADKVDLISEKKLQFKENIKKIGLFTLKIISIIILLFLLILILGFITRAFFRARRKNKRKRYKRIYQNKRRR